MTEEEKKAVEEAEAAAAQKKIDEAEPSEIEKQLAAKDAEIAKLAEERNNYKRGMLKAKGKVKDDDDDLEEDDIDTKIEKKVQEKLLDTQWMNAQKEKDEIIKKALERNKELEIAVKNRSQISKEGNGSSSEQKMAPKDAILTEEKLKQLKGMGWDDTKIERFKQNLIKNRG